MRGVTTASLLLLLGLLVLVQGAVLPVNTCEGVSCRPGRECVQLTNGENECVCMVRCPDHWKPTCGSDGVSYDNHCELHRTACLEGRPISPLHPGFCRKDRKELLAREEFIEELSQWGEEKKVPLPVACFENDRNRLREFLISWFDLSANKQSWYSHGMSFSEILTGHYTAMDKNRDGYLDSAEMFAYISRNNSNSETGTKTDKIRQLCLDALVEEGDVNMDWRLGYEEYREIMKEDYLPSTQVCKLNGRVYNDGAETKVECNGCVCACGKWICTSNKCSEGYSDIFKNTVGDDMDDDPEQEAEDAEEDGDYAEDGFGAEDEDEDEEDKEEDADTDPEDDPDVQDINWF